MKTIWLSEEKEQTTYIQAMEKFGPGKHPDKVLPTIGQLRRAWEKGIKFAPSRLYWSSSVDPCLSRVAYYFSGRYGYVGYGYRDDDVNSVRCISSKSNKVSLALVNYNE